jgi:hypothetical protein
MNRSVMVRVAMAALFIVVASVGFAQVDGLSADEQAEINAAAATGTQPPIIGAPVPHPDANGAGRAVAFFSDFEANNGGLAPTLDWEWGTFAWAGSASCSGGVPPAAPYSGSNMWGTVLNDCYSNLGNNTGYNTCVNGNTADDSVLSLTVDLSGYTDAQLSWWEWGDLYLNWDWGEVYVNGTAVFQHCGTGYVAPVAWVQQVVDLTAYAGGSVTIEFHMMSSTVVAYSGWYVDDVEVSGTPVPVELQSFSIE